MSCSCSIMAECAGRGVAVGLSFLLLGVVHGGVGGFAADDADVWDTAHGVYGCGSSGPPEGSVFGEYDHLFRVEAVSLFADA